MHYQEQRKIALFQRSNWLMINITRNDENGSQCLVCRFKNGWEGQAWQDWLFSWTRWGQGSAGILTVEAGQPDQERHHWILRGDGRWLPQIVLVMQGRGVFLREQKSNPNRLHTHLNKNVVQDSIRNTYNTIVLWLHTNTNWNVVQDSINNTYDTIVL